MRSRAVVISTNLYISTAHILALQPYNFKKRGLGEENSDTFENIKIIAIF